MGGYSRNERGTAVQSGKCYDMGLYTYKRYKGDDMTTEIYQKLSYSMTSRPPSLTEVNLFLKSETFDSGSEPDSNRTSLAYF